MTRKKQLSILTVLMVGFLAGLLTACGGSDSGSDPAAAEPPTITARTGVVEAVVVPDVAWISGSLAAARRVEPGTKILGRVDRVAVEEGQEVQRGQLLVQLEDADLRAAVAQSEAAVTMAEAQVENARSQQARMQELHGRGSVTDKNLEDAVAGLRVAEAQVQQAKANVTAALASLAYARVTSPFDGVVVGKFVEEGDMARPGARLVAVEDLSTVDVVAQVPEARIAGRSRGETVRVEVLGQTYEAPIERIVPSGDAASRTFRIEVTLDNESGALKSGMFARVGLEGSTSETLVLPTAARVERGQLRGAWVVSGDGTASVRWLRLGAETQQGFEILSGLDAGERVILEPPAGLVDGTLVQEP